MTLYLGNHVIYVDELRKEHNALVTTIHGNADDKPSINLVYVSMDENKIDPYGRQLERQTSCVHIDNQSAKANCYKQE